MQLVHFPFKSCIHFDTNYSHRSIESNPFIVYKLYL